MAANSRFAVATHILAAVASKGGESVSSAYLGSSVNTNPVIIRRILGDLQKAGLVETFSGKTGGARMAKKASQISLYDVFVAVDGGDLFAYNPNSPNRECPMSCQMKSVLEPIFESAEAALAKDLKRVSIADIVSDLKKKGCR